MSRLGNPVGRGAARFARPIETDVKTSERQKPESASADEEEAPPTQRRKAPAKQPVTIRLTPASVEQLAQLEIALRRHGVRARRASASEIVEALVQSTSAEQLLSLLKQRSTHA